MPGPLYRIDPVNGTTVAEDEEGNLTPSSASDAFGRPVEVNNGTVIDAASRTVLMTGSTADLWTVNANENNRLNVVTPASLRQINAPLAGPAQRLLSGDVTIRDGQGILHTFEVNGVNVNQIGKQLITYTDADNIQHFQQYAGSFRTNAEVEAALGAGYRLATASETIINSVKYYLGTNYGEELRKINESLGIEFGLGEPSAYELIPPSFELGSLANYQVATSRIIEG